MTRNSLIQRIHTLKRDLSLDDEMYRTILESIAGKRSCKDIDDEYLNLIYQTLNSQFQKTVQTRVRKNVQLQKKISKLGFLLNWNWKRISEFCYQQINKKSTQNCSAAELNKIINGMVAIINDKLAAGKIELSPKDLQDFLYYTQTHKSKEAA
jgi:phage gp16-like protein